MCEFLLGLLRYPFEHPGFTLQYLALGWIIATILMHYGIL